VAIVYRHAAPNKFPLAKRIFQMVTIFISSPLPPEYVDAIRVVDPSRAEVIYDPDLYPPIRYVADHKGKPFTRTTEQQRRWREHLSRAEVLWDFPPNEPDGSGGLAYAPRVKWIQGMSTGIGQKVKSLGLHNSDIICTTARGIHSRPIAEFVFLGLLIHVRGLRHLESEQRAHRWNAYCTDELAGKTLAIVGAGHMASKVAALGRAFGMRLLATARRYAPERAAEIGVDRFYPREQLHTMLREADALALTIPHTPETEGMIDAAALKALKPGSTFINIGRGQVVDEAALIEALRSGHIGFAALDVFTVEPLPASSPLWDMPNVLISPHSASAMPTENERLVELFSHNLRCYLDGRLSEMRNILDKKRLY
jgi:phosphoglycerate dehydrogenase-like enzyme